MTRKTALRRMLAGAKVEHPNWKQCFFAYDKNLDAPILFCRKRDSAIINNTSHILPIKKGWKE